MAGTFSQLYIHVVFSVRNRESVLLNSFSDLVYRYISGIIKEKGHKPIIVNGSTDHIHILFGLKPASAIADVVRDIKNNSAKFINESKFLHTKFSWQEGYGAFSCSSNDLDRIFKYIQDQKEHHRKQTFRQEYLQFLNDAKIAFNEKYVFDYDDQDSNDL